MRAGSVGVPQAVQVCSPGRRFWRYGSSAMAPLLRGDPRSASQPSEVVPEETLYIHEVGIEVVVAEVGFIIGVKAEVGADLAADEEALVDDILQARSETEIEARVGVFDLAEDAVD